MAICAGCNKEFKLETSKRQGNGFFDVNVRAVWGTMASGGGATDLQEQLSTLNIPPLTSNIFSSLDNTIGEWWSKSIKDDMLKAGAEERRKAIEKRGIFMKESPILLSFVMVGGPKGHKNTHTTHQVV
ncbi:hypothetical protein DPMN_161458 [Dreissena polymorpha]|uniref:Mutator-like transposase domain-containing protein n=1 Tax=Dreissena polymorpha TaxID=45954 RepID=A0A9D3Y3X2_DREPO|nr:hypothetical protein DPMN_192379 [Dreissena polymorpha]KAH3783520.1 hypothetical protein DPMN_161458 [Dreissena polymorpha]